MEAGSSQRPVDGEEAAAVGHGFRRGSGESKVFKELESVEFNEEVDGMLLDRTEAGFSGSSKDAQGDEVNGTGIISESHVRKGISAPVHDVAEFPVAESTDFEDDSVSEEVVISDGARVSHRAVGNWMNGFELGDMVWGKVKSHPWWPGYLFNEAFASSSVRRTRRDGHVLVAFFGDSSYGWFDPSELVPFDSHFEEKSKQTVLRPFAKAVEEATDEASRREALGLACYCRNKYNFGPARVPGYLDVDVPGFEPWGIYSSKQIEDSRKNFVPDQSLSFLKQLALCPLEDIVPAIDRIKNTAKMLAYRCSVFEEFDETYAQAFGVEPVRPRPLTGAMSDHPERFAPRAAPLSGQLVMPEPLRPKKSSAPKLASAPKVSKPPSAKKNKYVLKRRDEQFSTTATIAGPPLPDFTSPTQPYGNFYNLFPTTQQSPTQPSLAFQDASVHGDYVLQKRAPSVFIDDKLPQTSPSLLEQGPLNTEQRSATLGVDVPVAISPRKTPQMSVIEFRKLDPAVSGVVADAKEEILLARPNDVIVVDEIPKVKKKIKKRLRVDGSSDRTDLARNAKKKIKKKHKEQSNESGLLPDHAKMAKDDDPYRKLASRLNSIGPEQSKRADEVARATLSFPYSFQLPKIDLSSRSLQLPELVADLHELALDPFYGIERDASGVALHVFLKFRSMVYQKSLALSLPSEDDAVEVQAPKPPRSQQESVAGTAEIDPVKTAKEGKDPTASAKPPKPGFRSDDPVVAGRKHTPSDRQEDISAKRQKKVNKVKALASEKKSAISQKRNAKDAGSASTTMMPAVAAMHSVTAKPSNAKTMEPVKKQEPPPPRVPCPTTLVMKFPPRTTLPSIASLKARFARFGPLELSDTRVYWKSYTCKVVYKFKPDAEAALNYARANEMFGQVKVHFYLRDADTQSQESSADASGKKLESRQAEGVQFRPGSNPSTSLRLLPNPNHKPGLLKSILKKPGDDAGPITTISSSRETPRVKFMLDNVDGKPVMSPAVGGSSYSRSDAEPPPFSLPLESVINKTTKSGSFLPPPPLPPALHSYPSRIIDNSPYIPPPPVTPASSPSFGLPPSNRVAMDRVPPPPPPPSSLRGPRSADPLTQNYRQYGEAEGRPMVNKELANQMLSLMVRCSDIVRSVKSSLGYVPYHPL